MEQNLVSIITPAFRAEAYIAETIRSVVAQTWTNWEMLVVDDCSPDGTCALVERMAASDSRIRLIRQKENGGPAAARNAGLQHARGRWIAFLDSDDLWLPEKLTRQLIFHQACAAKISFTEFRRMDASGQHIGRLISVPDMLDYRRLLGNTAIATSSVMIDREKTGTVMMKKTYYDDFSCWLEILKQGGIAAGLHEDLLRYRVLGNSVSRNKKRSAIEVWKTYRLIEGLGLFVSGWYFAHYAIRGWLKYRKF